jgi:hypothetical protein
MRCVLAHCHGEESMSHASHPFTKGRQNLLIVDLVNGLTFRHPVNVNSPADIEKTFIIALKFDLLFHAFVFLVTWNSSNACIGT